MDKEAVGSSTSERGLTSSDTSPSPGAPAPPRLTPNPMLLLDSPVPLQTPVTSSPPPPLTPAPSISAPKMVAAAARTSSPHILVPVPPKLITTASPALRTYPRPILPCASKTTPHTSSSSAEDAASSASSSTSTLSPKTSSTLTNGSARSVPTPICNTITPFHTPASPPGRQAALPHPASSLGPPAARHRTSQQTLLLGKGLKGPGQEQVLLRAQMVSNAGTASGGRVASSCPLSVCGTQLQSRTPRPPLPAALAAPPSLRLKPPASAPPPLSRPQTALFPLLRPRPPSAPGRHLSVPPPTLYSPVRAVPLRPKVQSAQAPSPRLPSALQTPPASRPQTGVSILPASAPLPTASSSETAPPASRRLQIIALSSAWPPPPPFAQNARPTLSRREALPPPQIAASPPRRKESDALPGGLGDIQVAENDQRKEAEEESNAAAARKDADLLQRGQMDVTEEGRGGATAHGDREHPMELQEEGDSQPQTLKEGKKAKSYVRETFLPEELPVRHVEALPVPHPPPEPGVNAIRLPELPGDKAELCDDISDNKNDNINENVSAQSDNHSALSSLSSQSPPSSPVTDPASHAAAQPLNLSQSRRAVGDGSRGEGQTPTEAEPPLDRSEDEVEGGAADGPWESRAWPEGRDVLTHVVEGFVIQEGLQPFPVNRSSLLLLPTPPQAQKVNGSDGQAPVTVTEESTERWEHSTDSPDEDGKGAQQHATRASHCERAVLHCQFCGKRGHAHNFMRSKRFCSTSCARGFNVRLTKRLRALSAGSRAEKPPRPVLNRAQSVPGKPILLRLPRDLWSAGRRDKETKEDKKVAATEEEDEEDMEAAGEEEDQDDEGAEEPAVAVTTRMESPASERARTSTTSAVATVAASTPTSTFKPEPSQWTVEDVTAFIHTLPGCGEVSAAFRLQEIDGQALLLLTEEHLMGSMNIKLGPALKICAHINALKNL
ncbi:polyhomeotic-like protein 3 isoform X2 [Hippocampus zosterae]|uniref:polyhomeotic-like protein 3 isoform X2 n=1 Tax=Hippocampus zosterae TaxID=109293 RepID=UPI00223DCEA9|nr:polyhomeotic-like protein 3 isoform X2 [Hippocampus zosterae]